MRANNMEPWEPISEAEIRHLLHASLERMSPAQRQLWETISIPPVKWRQEPYGTEGGGFWVVAIYGKTMIWFNDIEDGFNRSSWSIPGEIEEYWCEQDQLEWTLQKVLDEMNPAR